VTHASTSVLFEKLVAKLVFKKLAYQHYTHSKNYPFFLGGRTHMYYFERFFSLKRYSSETKNDNNEHSILPTYDHFPEQMNFYLGRGMKRVF